MIALLTNRLASQLLDLITPPDYLHDGYLSMNFNYLTTCNFSILIVSNILPNVAYGFNQTTSYLCLKWSAKNVVFNVHIVTEIELISVTSRKLYFLIISQF